MKIQMFKLRSLLVIALMVVLLPMQLAQANGTDNMNSEISIIEAIRAEHDADIMAIEGVVTIATGRDKTGAPCLKIGTSGPPEEVRGKLPKAVLEICLEVERVGDIEAQ